jgi:hypothetical protein
MCSSFAQQAYFIILLPPWKEKNADFQLFLRLVLLQELKHGRRVAFFGICGMIFAK